MLHYTNVDYFMRYVLADHDADLSYYTDPRFCRQLKLKALNAIELILRNSLREFDKQLALNCHHPEIQLPVLDLAVLAGLHEITYSFAALGCETKHDINKFKQKLQASFDGHVTPIIHDIHKAIDLIEYGKRAIETKPQDKEFIHRLLKRINEMLHSLNPPDPEPGLTLRFHKDGVTDTLLFSAPRVESERRCNYRLHKVSILRQ